MTLSDSSTNEEKPPGLSAGTSVGNATCSRVPAVLVDDSWPIGRSTATVSVSVWPESGQDDPYRFGRRLGP